MEPTNPNANTCVNPLEHRKRHSRSNSFFFTLRHGAGYQLGTSPPSSAAVMKGLRFAFKSSTGVKVVADPHHERNNGIVPKSHETSSKSHTSSLQNERFVRDFLQKSHVKSPKRTFRTRLPPKVKRKHTSEHTRHAAPPSSFAIPVPPNNTRSHANPNVTATFTSTTTHNLTIPCACHENRTKFHTSKPAQSTAPATKSDHIMSCELQQNLHHTTRLE